MNAPAQGVSGGILAGNGRIPLGRAEKVLAYVAVRG